MDGAVLLLTLVHGVVAFAVFVSVLTAALRDRAHTAAHLRPAVTLGALLFLLQVPALSLTVFFLEPPGGHLVHVMAVLFAAVALVFSALYPLIQVPVAVRLRPEGSPFPVLLDGPDRLRGCTWGAMAGVAGGLVSIWAFAQAGVQEGEVFRTAREMMPGVDTESAAFVLCATLPAFLAAALAEELTYRGIIQPWLERTLGGHGPAALGAVVATSAVWALPHAANAQPMGPKLTQIFVLGLVFGWMARRFSVEAAMAGHVGLNVSVIAYLLI